MERRIKRVARIYDPALKQDALACAHYGRTRDEADLPLRDPDRPPVWFHYRRLTRSQVYRFVEVAPTEQEKLVRAFQCGIVKVEGGEHGAWSPVEAKRPKDCGGGFQLAPGSALVWDAVASRSAESGPSTPEKSSEKPKGD